jgi:DNA topoisomerase-3
VRRAVAGGRGQADRRGRLAPGAGDAGPDDADGEDAQRSQVLPALRAGLSCQVGQVDLKALKTLPPKPYTQGELVKAMKGVAKLVTDPRLKQKLKDTTGIGTEATRANIISGLLGRGYLVKKAASAHRMRPSR